MEAEPRKQRALQAVYEQLRRAHAQGHRCSLLLAAGERVWLMRNGVVQAQPEQAIINSYRALVDQACGFLPAMRATEAAVRDAACSL